MYFWITAIIVIIIGMPTFFDDSALDINVHDTYFVIARFHLATILTVIFLIIGLLYWGFYKLNIKLISILTNLHVLFSIGSYFTYHFGSLFFFNDSSLGNEFPLFDVLTKLDTFTNSLIIVFLIAQLLLISNIIFSLFKNGIQPTTSK